MLLSRDNLKGDYDGNEGSDKILFIAMYSVVITT